MKKPIKMSEIWFHGWFVHQCQNCGHRLYSFEKPIMNCRCGSPFEIVHVKDWTAADYFNVTKQEGFKEFMDSLFDKTKAIGEKYELKDDIIKELIEAVSDSIHVLVEARSEE